jgi:hypothetical protein
MRAASGGEQRSGFRLSPSEFRDWRPIATTYCVHVPIRGASARARAYRIRTDSATPSRGRLGDGLHVHDLMRPLCAVSNHNLSSVSADVLHARSVRSPRRTRKRSLAGPTGTPSYYRCITRQVRTQVD